jgi:hypothetical protein
MYTVHDYWSVVGAGYCMDPSHFAFRIVALFFGASKKNDKNKRETEKRHFLNLQESARKEKTLAPGPSLPNRSVVASSNNQQHKAKSEHYL